MKIRNGFVSNSSSSSFVLSYKKRLDMGDPNFEEEYKENVKEEDTITIVKDSDYRYVYYTLKDSEKKDFLKKIWPRYLCGSDLRPDVLINAEEMGESFEITPEMMGYTIETEGGQDDCISYLDTYSQDIDEFLY